MLKFEHKNLKKNKSKNINVIDNKNFRNIYDKNKSIDSPPPKFKNEKISTKTHNKEINFLL